MTNLLNEQVLPEGFELVGYRILRVLGRGGFGITYEAVSDLLEDRVAIKEFFPKGIASRSGATIVINDEDSAEVYERVLRRFEDEAKALRRLDHPNIVKIRHYVRGARTGYMIMDFVDGETLRARLDRLPGGHLESYEAFRAVFDPILNAVDYVHGRDMLHRDLAPDNIMIRSDGRPLLIDFGALRRDLRESKSHSSVVIAKEAYAPPEQMIFGQNLQGTYTDVYSVAASMYEALAGEPPQQAARRAFQHREFPYRPLASCALIDAPPEVYAAIDRALLLPTEDRPPSIAAFRDELGWSPAAARPTPPPANRPPAPAASWAPAGPSNPGLPVPAPAVPPGWPQPGPSNPGLPVPASAGPPGWQQPGASNPGQPVPASAVPPGWPQPGPSNPGQPVPASAVPPGWPQPGASNPGQPVPASAVPPGWPQPGPSNPGQPVPASAVPPGWAQPGASSPGQPVPASAVPPGWAQPGVSGPQAAGSPQAGPPAAAPPAIPALPPATPPVWAPAEAATWVRPPAQPERRASPVPVDETPDIPFDLEGLLRRRAGQDPASGTGPAGPPPAGTGTPYFTPLPEVEPRRSPFGLIVVIGLGVVVGLAAYAVVASGLLR